MGDSEVGVQFDIHLKLLKIRLTGSAFEEGAAGLEAMRLKVRGREGRWHMTYWPCKLFTHRCAQAEENSELDLTWCNRTTMFGEGALG